MTVRKVLPNGMSVYGVNRNEIDHLYKEIFQDEAYLPDGGVRLPGHPVVLDAGANIGLFTLYALRTWPGARVLAFEPAREVFDVLAMNVGHLGGVRLFNTALGSADRTRELTYYPHYTMMSGFDADPAADRALVRSYAENVSAGLGRQGWASEEEFDDVVGWRFEEFTTVPCRVRRIESVLADLDADRIDFLKVDVEGSELGVLQGIGDRLWPSIRYASVEVEDSRGSLAAIRALFARNGMATSVRQAPEFRGTHVFTLFASRTG